MTELENKMAALKLLQSETNDKVKDYQQQIADLQKQIDDYNKPELTPMQMDDIQEAVEKAVEGFDFSNTDNYEFEYGIEYDGKVYCETVDLQAAYELIEQIVGNVFKLFKETECPTDEENARDDKEAEELSDQLNKAQ